MAKDYYSILGIQRGASESEIKQAYRNLSRQLHPDKHKGDKEKEAKFKEVNEAYEVLSDPKKKQMYDQFGSADGSPFGGGGGGFSGFSGFQGGFGGFDVNDLGGLGDIFESFFSGGASRGGPRRRSDGAGRDIEIAITVPFAAAVTGVERQVQFKANVQCDACGGSGSADGAKMINCDTCNGTGAVVRSSQSLFGTIRQSVVCSTCHGSGKVPEKPCPKCKGEGRVTETKTVTVNIPAGIATGQSLKVSAEGEAGRQGGKPGDLYVRVTVEEDRRFERQGDDIRTSLEIPVVDAVLGADIDVETVHGPVTLSVPAGTQPGQILRIKNKGMPVLNTSRHGDQYVTIEIEVPKKLSKEERRLFEELKNTQ